MAGCFNYALIQIAPQNSRNERLNIGVAVFGDNSLDIHVARKLDKIHAISAAIEIDSLKSLLKKIENLDEYARQVGLATPTDRADFVGKIAPLEFSSLSSFDSHSTEDYQAIIALLMKNLVEPEPAPPVIRPKRSRLLTELKSELRKVRVLAQPTEGIESHRVVSSFVIDAGLVADLALRNGAWHILETVDASGDADHFRKSISDIATSALILERARMKFGEMHTKAKLIYSASPQIEAIAMPSLEAVANQGTELCNWASDVDRIRLVNDISSLASPIARPNKRKHKELGFIRKFH